MPASLVCCYGEKPDELARLIQKIQSMLTSHFQDAFQPYQSEQVHATIIGLETQSVEGKQYSKWCIENRIESNPVDWENLFDFLQNEKPLITIQIGGYQIHGDYGFKSRNKSPYTRSFSIDENRVVINGWPVIQTVTGLRATWDLYNYRKQFRAFQICHKWNKDGYQDNDFFMVLGKLKEVSYHSESQKIIMKEVRDILAEEEVIFTLYPQLFSLVWYENTELPIESTKVFRLIEPELRDFRNSGHL